MINSHLNDWDFEIKVEVRYPEGGEQPEPLLSYWTLGDSKTHYLARERGSDGNLHRRVCWLNAGNGLGGSTQPLFETYAMVSYQQLDDYAFDVYVVDELVFLAVTTTRGFEDGLPKRNTRQETNQFIYLAALAQENANVQEKARLTHKLPRGNYFNASGQAEEYFFWCQEPEIDGGVGWAEFYESVGDPRIDWVQVQRENGAPSFIQIYGTMSRIMYSEDEVPYGGTGFRLRSGDHGIFCYNDYYVESGMGKDEYACHPP